MDYSSGINTVLDEIAVLAYPTWLSSVAPYLPELDFQCVAISGKNYLNNSLSNSTSATVAGLLNAVTTGCRNNDLVLSGGYNKDTEELEINFIETSNGNRKL